MLPTTESGKPAEAKEDGAAPTSRSSPSNTAKRRRRVTDFFKPIPGAKKRLSAPSSKVEETLAVQAEQSEQPLQGSGVASDATAVPPVATPASNRPDKAVTRRLPQSFAKDPAGKVEKERAIQQLPYLNYRQHGRILYACTAEEVENACKSFLQQNVKLVGWDLEWRTTFRSGEPPRKTALMQLCYTLAGKHICLLLHIFHSGITPSVEAFLSTPEILKTGVNVSGDAHKIHRDFGIQVEGVCELMSHPIPQAEPLQSSRSLASLAERYLGCQVLKGSQQLSNWETRPLSLEQQNYAATDAFAALCIYQTFQAMQQPEQPPPLRAVPPLTAPEEPSVWIPAVPGAKALQPAKAAVYQLLIEQKLSFAQVAALRKIQGTSVASYLAEAIVCGHGYFWPIHSVPMAALACTAAFSKQLLAQLGGDIGCDNIANELLKVGVGLRECQTRLGLELDFGQIRLLLAHIGRQRMLVQQGCESCG